MSSSNSPCAACKLQRRKCTQECIYAPYFPPDQPQKFANVHKVFGASNVAKLLHELNAVDREDAVHSLAYEAEARLRDPVYGCVGVISVLQRNLKLIQNDLLVTKKELSAYLGPSAMLPILQHSGYMPQQQMANPSSSLVPYNMSPMMGLPTGASHGGQLVIREPQLQPQLQLYQQQKHQILEAQQMAALEQQEMFRAFEQQQGRRQEELLRLNSGFDAGGFGQMAQAAMGPSLALGKLENPY